MSLTTNHAEAVTSAGRAAMLGAVGIGLVVGLTATFASATSTPPVAPTLSAPISSGATLLIHQADNGSHTVSISGTLPMSEQDARSYIEGLAGGGVRYTLFGDDPGDDDSARFRRFYAGASRPGERTRGYLYATAEGVRFLREITVAAGVLDEDDSPTDAVDEIYVSAMFIDGDGGLHTVSSNVVVDTY